MRDARTVRPERIFGALALAASTIFLPGQAQERFRRTPPLPDAQPRELRLPAIERTTLPNGLLVAAAFRPEAPLVTLQLVVRAGEADSPPELPGVAALTARMVGRDSRYIPGSDLEAMVESIGARYSVDVLMDYTVFRLDVLEEFFDRALYLLRMMALETVFSEREFAAVKRTRYWELYSRRKDPESLGWWLLLRLLFRDHPYGNALYAEDVIKFVTVRDAAIFYARHYRPDNAVLLVSGPIPVAEAAVRARRHLGVWTGEPTPQRPLPNAVPNQKERVCFIEDAEATDAFVFAGNVIMDSSDPDFFPFVVLKQILGGTTQSRLFMNLRESKGIAYYAFSETEFYRRAGVFWARARVRPESILPAAREIAAEINALSSTPPAPAEIEEAKSSLIGSLSTRFESIDGFAEWMARHVALDLDESQWDRGPERFKLVNVEQAAAAARKYLSAKPLVVVVGRPEWADRLIQGVATVEVYDRSGALKETRRRREWP